MKNKAITLLRLNRICFREEAIIMAKSPFLSSVESFMLTRRYSRRTVNTYLYWIKYFIVFNDKQHP
jgi:hypothetical protein